MAHVVVVNGRPCSMETLIEWHDELAHSTNKYTKNQPESLKLAVAIKTDYTHVTNLAEADCVFLYRPSRLNTQTKRPYRPRTAWGTRWRWQGHDGAGGLRGWRHVHGQCGHRHNHRAVRHPLPADIIMANINTQNHLQGFMCPFNAILYIEKTCQ